MSALRSFLDKTTNPRMYRAVEELLFFVDSGDNFSTAMKKLPMIFEKREVAIIESGEQSGSMQRSFLKLSEEIRAEQELKSKVKGSLAYPAIIICFLVGAVLVIMTYVIPNLLPLFTQTGVELPLATRSLIATSDFVTHNFILIVLAIAATIFGLRLYLSTRDGRVALERFLLAAPVIGTVYKNYCITRVSASLSLLLGAGISVMKTLRLTGEGTDTVTYEAVLEEVARNVAEGRKLAASFELADPDFRYLSQDFMQMIAAAEQTSTVDKVAGKIAEQYRREVESSLSTLVKFVEPAALLLAGGFVLWFALAIFSAVIKITDTVG
jgi:MSHA biogenesis protein MshG